MFSKFFVPSYRHVRTFKRAFVWITVVGICAACLKSSMNSLIETRNFIGLQSSPHQTRRTFDNVRIASGDCRKSPFFGTVFSSTDVVFVQIFTDDGSRRVFVANSSVIINRRADRRSFASNNRTRSTLFSAVLLVDCLSGRGPSSADPSLLTQHPAHTLAHS